MSMKKILIPIVAIIALLAIGYGAYVLTQSSTTTDTTSSTPEPSTAVSASPSAASPSTSSTAITSAQLAKNNGKSGAKCWVAINGTVYDVSNSNEWRNGEHTPSNGQAKCGRDESSSIGASPHGSSVLSSLPTVGTLAQ